MLRWAQQCLQKPMSFGKSTYLYPAKKWLLKTAVQTAHSLTWCRHFMRSRDPNSYIHYPSHIKGLQIGLWVRPAGGSAGTAHPPIFNPSIKSINNMKQFCSLLCLRFMRRQLCTKRRHRSYFPVNAPPCFQFF